MVGQSQEHLSTGIYESLVTRALAREIEKLTSVGLRADQPAVDDAEWPSVLSKHIAGVVRRALLSAPEGRPRLELAERLLELVESPAPADEYIDPPVRLLRAVQHSQPGPGKPHLPSPVLGVGQSDLLVNGRGEPNLLHSLRSEIASADRIDLVVAFIKRTGLRPLLEPLTVARERGVRIRVLTTTYLGGTDERAVNDLVDLGASVKVSYDLSMTRLHAKGWLFERNTGFHTAYIGSSNLSHSAMTQGQEWNVRLAAAQTPELVDKFRAAVAAYWDDPALGFEAYERSSALEERLARALREARGGGRFDLADDLSPFTIRPLPHQEVILEDLAREREVYGRHRNLVVAATGTGKTAVAAFDYQRLAAGAPTTQRPRLLFVAHRAEILQQSRRMFRHVLRSGDFGELLTGDHRPEQWRHVFANIQSLSADRLRGIDPEAFDMVVVDEFHHAAASSYVALLDRMRPRVLLGLTATPERMDGQDVLGWFGGHIASELRLWDALEQKLLSPFHYYGAGHESLDFRKAGWSNGRYTTEGLDKVLTGDTITMDWVIAQIHDKVTDPRRMRALAFASTVKHAHFVADRLRRAGIAAVALDSGTPKSQRDQALADLRDGQIQVVVTVDLFNEGVDVPSVDTILMLRPTESITIFLQQLGRGLRRDEGKDVLTVLDFIGFQDRRFRFDLRFRALTGVTRSQLIAAVEDGFPYLPAGSYITLDRVAQDAVLENVKAHVPSSIKALVDDVLRHAQAREVNRYRLGEYLDDAVADLTDVYRRTTWTSVCRQAGLETVAGAASGTDEEASLLKRVGALAHIDDLPRLRAYRRLVSGSTGPRSAHDDVLANMLMFTLWPALRVDSPYEGLDRLRRFPAVVDELLQLWEVCEQRIPHVTYPLTGSLSVSPLQVHGRYTREEMLAGILWARSGTNPRVPKGHAAGTREVSELAMDAFDITWRKTEKAYSPTTMYQDYAISPSEIHWESPNALAYDASTTRRYVEHESRGRSILLFARESKQGQSGTQPLLFLGPATYLHHEGSRPVSFRWRLDRPMPTEFYETARVVTA